MLNVALLKIIVAVPPAAVVNQYPSDQFVFVGCCDDGVRLGNNVIEHM